MCDDDIGASTGGLELSRTQLSDRRSRQVAPLSRAQLPDSSAVRQPGRQHGVNHRVEPVRVNGSQRHEETRTLNWCLRDRGEVVEEGTSKVPAARRPVFVLAESRDSRIQRRQSTTKRRTVNARDALVVEGRDAVQSRSREANDTQGGTSAHRGSETFGFPVNISHQAHERPRGLPGIARRHVRQRQNTTPTQHRCTLHRFRCDP